MSDLSKPSDASQPRPGMWFSARKAAARLLDWFAIQSTATRLTVLVLALLIPASAIYSYVLVQKQAAMAEQVKTMAVAGKSGEGVWSLNDKLPVVLGTGSVLELP